jgi:hypothetical protein
MTLMLGQYTNDTYIYQGAKFVPILSRTASGVGTRYSLPAHSRLRPWSDKPWQASLGEGGMGDCRSVYVAQSRVVQSRRRGHHRVGTVGEQLSTVCLLHCQQTVIC